MASAEDDSEDGEDTQDQSMSVDIAQKIPSHDDDIEEVAQDYSSLFRRHVDATRAHLCGETDEEGIENDKDHIDDGWTSSEKNLFFHALPLYSRWRPDLIASSISTKSTMDVCLYIDRLEEALSYAQSDDEVSREDFACSHEMSHEWIEREEYEARVYAAYEIDAEERDKQHRREGKRSSSQSCCSSSRPAKRRKVSDVDDDEDLELAWAREDQFEHLDTWVLKRMAYLLNAQEDECTIDDEDQDPEEGDLDLDPSSSQPRPALSPFPSSGLTLTPQTSQSNLESQSQSHRPSTPIEADHRPSTPTEAEILASLSPRSRRRFKKTLHMRRKRGDTRIGLEKGRRGPRAKPVVPASGRGRGRPRTRRGGGRRSGGGRSGGGEVDEEEDDDENMFQNDDDEDDEDELEVEEDLRHPDSDPNSPPSAAPTPTASQEANTSATPATFRSTTRMLVPTTATVGSTSRGLGSTTRMLVPETISLMPPTTAPPMTKGKQAQANCARARDAQLAESHSIIHPSSQDAPDEQDPPRKTPSQRHTAPQPYRHVKPSGPTPLNRAQRTLDALRVTADYLVGEGLGLFHLGRVGEMVNLHYALNSPLTSTHLTSDTSVGLSAPALRVMEALVVDFVEGVVQAAVANREMEGAQKRSAVWNLGKFKGKGKARSRSRSEKRGDAVDDDNDEEEDEEEEDPVEDDVQRVTRTNVYNALDKVGVTHEERTRKGYFQRLIRRLRERRDGGVFDDDEEELVFSDDDDAEDKDEDAHEDEHPSPQTDAELLPIMHPLPVSLSSLFERSLSYTTPLLRPIPNGCTQGQGQSQGQSYSQSRSQAVDGTIELNLMDAETDEDELGMELEEEEELDQLDQEEAEEEENGMWSGLGG